MRKRIFVILIAILCIAGGSYAQNGSIFNGYKYIIINPTECADVARDTYDKIENSTIHALSAYGITVLYEHQMNESVKEEYKQHPNYFATLQISQNEASSFFNLSYDFFDCNGENIFHTNRQINAFYYSFNSAITLAWKCIRYTQDALYGYRFDPSESPSIDRKAVYAMRNTEDEEEEESGYEIDATQSLVDIYIPKTKSSASNTFAVIMANEDYRNNASVPYAKNDGTIFRQYCENTLGIPASHIHYVENATYNDFRLQLAWLNNVCHKYDGEASVILYYAGHGIPDASDKSSYLLPVDGDGSYVVTAYKLDDLYAALGKMPTKSTIVFLDACFSGANRDGKMLVAERGVALKAKSSVPQGNMVVFSAAQGDETALPNEEEGHGMFTYYLLKKLQDTEGDVTLQDLSQYIIREVGRRSAVLSKPQTPCVTPSAAVGTEWQSWKLK